MAVESSAAKPFHRAELDLAGLDRNQKTFEDFLAVWQGVKSEWEAYALLDHLPHLQFLFHQPNSWGGAQYFCDEAGADCLKLEFLFDLASPLADWETERDLLELQGAALRTVGVILNRRGRSGDLASRVDETTVSRLVACTEAWRGFTHSCSGEGATRGYVAMLGFCDLILERMMRIEWLWSRDIVQLEVQKRREQEQLSKFFATRQSLVNLLLDLGRLHVFECREVLRPTAEAVASYVLFSLPEITDDTPVDPWELGFFRSC